MNNKLQKEAFIEAYRITYGNITKSCQAAGWKSRTTFYENVKSDLVFAEAIESINPKELFMDFLESKLVDRIKDDDTTALIFALKTQAKKRGYADKIEIGTEDNNAIKIEIVDGRNKDQ
jgi:hypothetical protein